MSINPIENQANVQDTAKQNDKEYNFAQIRKQLEQEKAARLQAEERAAAAERMAQDKRGDDDDSPDEPYVDHKRLDKKLAKFQQNMEKTIDEKAEKKAYAMIEEERRHNYLKENDDFEEVMGSENVKKFAEKHPRLANNILRMPEGFERQKLVYENIKALGVNKKEEAQSIQNKIDANRRSPGYQPPGMGSPGYGTSMVGGKDYSVSEQKNAYEKMQELKRTLRI